jgi:hypothetical protein
LCSGINGTLEGLLHHINKRRRKMFAMRRKEVFNYPASKELRNGGYDG